ncbi:dynein light chain 1, cytoplasmic-like [Cervus canadensis]|uniref:dynein light chain 1, cytoplasmic-like n=1 Tax=Cervus canadensis TaxID=1574408 RepID=UPI001C9E5AC5|nr:dynein light chain 1, cytoplasmic-like [Cervus canadensis]
MLLDCIPTSALSKSGEENWYDFNASVSLASASPRRPLQPAGPRSVVTTCDRKAVIKNAHMSEEMQQDSVECATQALEKYNIEDIVAHIKESDKKYSPTWHRIVGRNFSSYVTRETKHFIYFYLGQVAILLLKARTVPHTQ